MNLAQRIDLARGIAQADLVIRNCRVVNVLSGEIHEANVGIADGIFLGFGDYSAKRTVDAEGRYLLPSLVDGHIHIESTMLRPSRFAQAIGERGTAAAICDPHEIANVLGREGVEYMIQASEGLPVSIFFTVPSCVPATDMETSGACLTAEDVRYFLDTYPHRMLGLAELMNFPGVLFKDPAVLAKLEAVGEKPVDGHAPLLSGLDLNAYRIAGPQNDHECTTPEEALEKLRAGFHVMMREGSLEKNLKDLLPAMNGFNAQNLSLVTDDRNAKDLRDNGHLDFAVKMCVALGVPAVQAVQMASINTTRHYGLRGYGAIAPGYKANCWLVDDLQDFAIHAVYLNGKPLEEHSFSPRSAPLLSKSMHVGNEIDETLFAPDPMPASGAEKIRVMGVTPGSLITDNREMVPTLRDNTPVADATRDLCKLTVVERHHATGNHATAFVQGLGLTEGALAGTVAHDSHNLFVAGMNDADMVLAAKETISMGGGFVAVKNGKVLAKLPLPIAGLMSDKELPLVAEDVETLNQATKELGCSFNPFMVVSFLCLPVIPSLKLTDKGLVDVNAFAMTSLWVS